MLKKKILNQSAKIGIIGLGYVGLSLAVLLAKNKFKVQGFEIDKVKIKALNNGKNYLKDILDSKLIYQLVQKKFLQVTNVFSKLKKQDIVFICVPTPVDRKKKPDLKPLEMAVLNIAKYLRKGQLIINESTVMPTYTEKKILPVLEKISHLHAGTDFYLASSPERVDPGTKNKIENIAKVVGGIDKKSSDLAGLIYQQVISAPVVKVSSPSTAEASKILENTYRAINIAFVNEFAKICEKLNLDVKEVIQSASTKWNFVPHWPSLGVGGHCIPVDPYYLLDLAKENKIAMPFIKLGLKTNESMIDFTFKKVLRALDEVKTKKPSIILYGISYKADIADLRESPSLELAHKLLEKNILFKVYDPYFSANQIKKFGFVPLKKMQKADILIIGAGHIKLKQDFKQLVNLNTIIIDGVNFLKRKLGRKVYGIGRSF